MSWMTTSQRGPMVAAIALATGRRKGNSSSMWSIPWPRSSPFRLAIAQASWVVNNFLSRRPPSPSLPDRRTGRSSPGRPSKEGRSGGPHPCPAPDAERAPATGRGRPPPRRGRAPERHRPGRRGRQAGGGPGGRLRGSSRSPPLPTVAATDRSAGALGDLGRDHKGGLDLQLDVVAGEGDGPRQAVPVEPEVQAVEPPAGAHPDPLLAPEGVGHLALVGDVEGHHPGRLLDGQLAVDPVSVLARLLDTLEAVGHGRVPLGLEEVGRAEVVVPLLDAGGDARHLDRDLAVGL